MEFLFRVTPVQKLVADLGMPANLFFRAVDELTSSGQLRGQITGGRNIDRALYVPEIYNELLRVYVLGFFQQNGYLGERFMLSGREHEDDFLFTLENVLVENSV